MLRKCIASTYKTCAVKPQFLTSLNASRKVAFFSSKDSSANVKSVETVNAATEMRFNISKTEDEDELLQRVLSLENASQAEINKRQIQKAIEAFQRFPGDTGSSEVQIAVLTQRIKYLTEHAKNHKHDHHSRRGLLALVQKRRSLLKFLKKENLSMFKTVTQTLGIRLN